MRDKYPPVSLHSNLGYYALSCFNKEIMSKRLTTEQFVAKAYDMETWLLANLKSKYKQPTTKFDGYTECFLDVDRQDLLRRIAELT